MMGTTPALLLTCEQASRLHNHIQEYRHYAFAALVPSTTRNTTLRILQTVQGKLIGGIDQHLNEWYLPLAPEEMATLKEIAAALLVLYAQEPASTERNTRLTDLATLKASLNRS